MKARVALAALLLASPAGAQVHWDGAVQAGAYKRFLSSKIAGDAMFGPTVGASAHLALLPFVRVGLYGSWDLSPVDGSPAPPRMFFAFGAEGKIFSPWPAGDLRLFLTLGVGYAGAVAPGGYAITLHPMDQPGRTFAATGDASGGGFLELPVGIGASYKFRGPWFVYAEILSRFGFGFWGTLYGEKGGRVVHEPTLGTQAIGFDGYDVAALGLALGVGFDK